MLCRWRWFAYLVDGYSLLHSWPELAAGAPRHSERARDALVEQLHAVPGRLRHAGDGIFRRAACARPDEAEKTRPATSVEVLFSGTPARRRMI
jgi:hypothetical protein